MMIFTTYSYTHTAFSADSTPIYASGRVILDGTIVVDQSLDLAGGCQYAMGAGCSTTGSGSDSVLGVQVSTKGAGPYSPYGVSYGVNEQTLVPLNGPGFEGNNKVYQQYVPLDASDAMAAECTNVYVDNKYGDDAVDVAVTLNGVALENGVTEGTRTTYPITECTSSERERKLSGGGLFGVILASLVLCCCIAALLNYFNEFYTERMGGEIITDGNDSSAAGSGAKVA